MTTTSQAAPKAKGMCIATRCTTVDQFVDMFHRFVDEDSFFVSTMNTRPPGLETSFSVQLADGTPVLRGLCTVLQVWTTASSPFKTPGVRLGIKRLTANSMPVFERLLVTRSKPAPPPPPPPALAAGTVRPAETTAVIEAPTFSESARTKIAQRPQTLAAPPPTLPGLPAPPTRPTPPPMSSAAAAVAAATATVTESGETRTPGSELVLPANPLMNLTDASLEGYVDCTLYEETGSFFPVDDTGAPIDELVPPPTAAAVPVLAPRPVARLSTPVEIVSELGLEEPPPSAEPTVESTVEPPRVLRATPPPMPIVAAPDREPPPGSGLPVPAPALPVPAPSLALRDSTPAGEITGAQPRISGRRGLLLVGAIVAAAAGAALWVTMSSHDDADASTTGTPTRSAANAGPTEAEPQVAKPAVEPPPPPAPEPPEPDAEPEEPAEPADPPDAQSPVAGDGPCSVVVTSTPAGSTVLLDGKVIAPSPIMLATTCERHRIDIKHPRYKLATKFVTLKEGSPGSIDTTLQRPTHTVKVTSQPSNATIYIDGRRAGTTPTVVSVMGFSNLTLEIKKTGYATMSRKLYSKVAQDSVSVKLSKW